MANLNRGRDLPRAPQLKVQKGVPRSEEAQAQMKRARRRSIVQSKLAKATKAHGFDTLFPSGVIGTEKMKQKECKLVIEALSLGLTVHPQMLKLHGLEPMPNPRVYVEDDGKAPF